MKKEKIVIIDYQLGNLFSVKQACDIVGMNSIISSNKEDIINANALVLPGVGAFKEAMNNLNNLDLIAHLLYYYKNPTSLNSYYILYESKL